MFGSTILCGPRSRRMWFSSVLAVATSRKACVSLVMRASGSRRFFTANRWSKCSSYRPPIRGCCQETVTMNERIHEWHRLLLSSIEERKDTLTCAEVASILQPFFRARESLFFFRFFHTTHKHKLYITFRTRSSPAAKLFRSHKFFSDYNYNCAYHT